MKHATIQRDCDCGSALRCRCFAFYQLLLHGAPVFERLWRAIDRRRCNLDSDTFVNWSVSTSLPAKAEQEAIAEALSDADALIESLEQLIAKKRHLKQGAMQELLTGKKRLPGFSGEWDGKTGLATIVCDRKAKSACTSPTAEHGRF